METESVDELHIVSKNYVQKLWERKALRIGTKGNISRIYTFISKNDNVMFAEELECRLHILKADFKRRMSTQTTIGQMSTETQATLS